MSGNYPNCPNHHCVSKTRAISQPGEPSSAKFKGGCRGLAKIRQRGGGGCSIFFIFAR